MSMRDLEHPATHGRASAGSFARLMLGGPAPLGRLGGLLAVVLSPSQELQLVTAFYKANPLGLNRKDILRELIEVSKTSTAREPIDLLGIKERASRIRDEFRNMSTHRTRDIIFETRDLSDYLPRATGTARLVISDRLGTLDLEQEARRNAILNEAEIRPDEALRFRPSAFR